MQMLTIIDKGPFFGMLFQATALLGDTKDSLLSLLKYFRSGNEPLMYDLRL